MKQVIQRSPPQKKQLQHLSVKLRNLQKDKPTLNYSFNFAAAKFTLDGGVREPINTSKRLRGYRYAHDVRDRERGDRGDRGDMGDRIDRGDGGLDVMEERGKIGTMRVGDKVRAQKRKVAWNISANSMTRETSPSFAMPKASRFPEKQSQYMLPSLELKMGSSLTTKGTTFPKNPRRQLFKNPEVTPPPTQYQPRRYLQSSSVEPNTSSYSLQKSIKVCEEGDEHIRGGCFNKFNRYEHLYYPHAQKLPYNDRIIKQEQVRVERVKCFDVDQLLSL